MKSRIVMAMLAATVMMQGAISTSHAGEMTAGDILMHTVTLPVRLVGGGLTGTYGFLKGGVEGSYDLSSEAHDKIVEAGTSPAQILIWPFTIPVGFLKGSLTGFAEQFPTGYNYIDGSK